jgi:predicted PurR-regulated permease PerM
MGEPLLRSEEKTEDSRHDGLSPIASTMRVQNDVAPAAILKVGGALLAAWLVVKVWPVLVLVLISLMLVATFNPVVRRLQTRVNRTGAITVVTLGVLLLGALFVMLMIPSLIDQAHYLRTDLPRYAGVIEATARRAGVPIKLTVAATDWTERIAALGPELVNLFTNVLSGVAGAVTVAVLTVYLLIDGPRVEVELMRLLPRAERRPVRRMLDEIATQVGAYTRGQLVSSALAGLFVFVLLWLLHVPEPLALASLMAVANAIPMVGALLGTVPAVLMALTRGAPTALAVTAGYLLYFQFENQFLIPRMYSQSMKLSPSAVIIAISIGATLMGIPGAVLALPVAAALRVIFRFVREWQARAA